MKLENDLFRYRWKIKIIIVIEAAGRNESQGREMVGAWAGSSRVDGSSPSCGPEM